jgi:hypothetical protein
MRNLYGAIYSHSATGPEGVLGTKSVFVLLAVRDRRCGRIKYSKRKTSWHPWVAPSPVGEKLQEVKGPEVPKLGSDRQTDRQGTAHAPHTIASAFSEL